VLSTVEGLLSSVTISDPLQRGNPLVFASAGFEALTGYVSDEMMGVNCKVLQGKAPDKAKVALLKQGMTDRHFTSVEVVNYRKDGRSFNNLLCVVPVVDACDTLLRFVGVQCDLDERRRKDNADEHFPARWQEQARGPPCSVYCTAQLLHCK
jgi:PAS domain S-box-containing protein